MVGLGLTTNPPHSLLRVSGNFSIPTIARCPEVGRRSNHYERPITSPVSVSRSISMNAGRVARPGMVLMVPIKG